jgi:hypothetical protein
MTSILDLDPRWKALQAMGGVMDIGFDHPTTWPHAAREAKPFVKVGDDQLASELCRLGEARFICATFSLPIRGSEDHVVIALWAEVSHEGFYAYIETFDDGSTPEPMNAKLASELGPLCAKAAGLTLSFSTGDARPTATLEGASDISLDHLIDLYEATGSLERGDLTVK